MAPLNDKNNFTINAHIKIIIRTMFYVYVTDRWRTNVEMTIDSSFQKYTRVYRPFHQTAASWKGCLLSAQRQYCFLRRNELTAWAWLVERKSKSKLKCNAKFLWKVFVKTSICCFFFSFFGVQLDASWIKETMYATILSRNRVLPCNW